MAYYKVRIEVWCDWDLVASEPYPYIGRFGRHCDRLRRPLLRVSGPRWELRVLVTIRRHNQPPELVET